MDNILVVCCDERFRGTCTKGLSNSEMKIHYVDSSKDALDYLDTHNDIDLVILHTANCGQDAFKILEIIHSFKPYVSILLTSDSFNYWNNFRSWLADDCIVNSGDVSELRNRVSKLLGSKSDPKQRKINHQRFSVDWDQTFTGQNNL